MPIRAAQQLSRPGASSDAAEATTSRIPSSPWSAGICGQPSISGTGSTGPASDSPTCRQADVERWMFSDAVRHRREPRPLRGLDSRPEDRPRSQLPGCQMERFLPGDGRRSPMGPPAVCCTTTLSSPKAGPLLLRYARWPAVNSRLTVDHIEETDRAVPLASASPGRAARPRRRTGPPSGCGPPQPCRSRPDRITLAIPRRPAWPPDDRPGMGERLRKLGIRLADRDPLNCPVPARHRAATTVLARAPGTGITVAVKWQRAAAGDWDAYAAEVSRRTSLQPPIQEPGVPT